MAILTINHVSKSFAETLILSDITFEMQAADRVGLVGVNGSGKTTLFKVLTGEYEHDEGSISFAKTAQLGYMEQHVCADTNQTAFQEVLSVFSHLLDIEVQLDEINKALTKQLPPEEMDRLILRQTSLNDKFVDEGGLTCRSRVRSSLLGLGFTENQLENPVAVLSGGQKAKLQLAKLLLSGANLLLLDEPTNHLDIEAVEWLEHFLDEYSGAYIVISHDRYFLDKATTRTFEMEHQKLTAYKGNYSRFVELKAENRLSRKRAYDNSMKEIQRLEGIIEQQKRWNQARNYITIASKQKQIDRISADLDKPESDPMSLKFNFHSSRRSGDEVLKAENLSLSFDGVPLFQNVSLDIRRGEKIFLLGPNGCGKTSLLKILLKQYKACGGWFDFGVGVDTGYYQQSQSGLSDEKTVIDEIWDLHPSLDQTEIRSALAIFLFRGEDVFKQVGALSGGERARLLLLKLMMSKTNFLLLDEPTNHLDIGSREALENTLIDYEGTLLVVSHDRYLINKLADKIYYLDSQGTTKYEGNYDDFLRARSSAQAAVVQQAPKPAQNSYKMKKENEANLRKHRAALSRCEREVEENDLLLEELIEALNKPENAADYEITMSLSQEIAQRKAEAESLMSQWTDLSESIEELQSYIS